MAKQKINPTPSVNGTVENHPGEPTGPELEVEAGDTSFDPSRFEVETKTPPTPTQPAFDPFDPEHLGLDQDFASMTSAKPKLTKVLLGKPAPSKVFRIHPHPTFQQNTTLLVLKDENKIYIVDKSMRDYLKDSPLYGKYALFAGVSKLGTPFIWPIRLQDDDGDWNEWHVSAYNAAQTAKRTWVRIEASKEMRGYRVIEDLRPTDQQKAPVWPEEPLRVWLALAFQNCVIDSIDHPTIKSLDMRD